MVKLNIEMSMADMIVKVARTSEHDVLPKSSSHAPFPESRSFHQQTMRDDNDDMHVGPQNTAVIAHSQPDGTQREDIKGISRQTEFQVYVGDSDSDFRTDSIEQTKDTHHKHSYESQVPLKDLNRSARQQ